MATATADTPHVAIATSGGLDSSAIAATAARLGRAARITCYTLVPPAGPDIDVGRRRYLDERAKVEALGRMHPALDLNFLADETSHPLECDATRRFARAGVPVLWPAALGAFAHIYDGAVADGHAALLLGSLGNVGLTYHGWFSLPCLLRSGHWMTFARDFVALAAHDNRGLVRTIGGEVVMPVLPLRLLRLIHRLRGRDPDSVARFSPLNPSLIAELDLPRQWRAQGFDPWRIPRQRRDPARTRAYFLFDHNQFARDGKAGSRTLFGCEARDPHADRRLLEFLLTVPEPMYRRHGVPRSFARAVFADRLPREILGERRRGANAVGWFRRLEARRQDIEAELDRMQTSPLARRLIDVPRLKALMTQWPQNADEAQNRWHEYLSMLSRGVHVGQFIRWVEGGNA